MDENISRNLIINSLFWKFFERGSTTGIQFFVSVILARLLLPEMYGTVALVMVFITLSQVFVQSGLGTALIQKKDADDVDFSSVFFISLGMAVILYVVLFAFAPIISKYYKDDQLTSILRVLGINLLFGAVNTIQNAYVSRKMMFKELFKRSLGAMLISGTAGIAAAYAGFGIWALVVQQCLNNLFVTVIMWFTIKWRPIPVFSFLRVKALFSFGWKVLVTSLIDHFYKDLRTLIIGRLYSPSTLGFFSKGEQFPKLIVSNINGSIQTVMLPAFATHQEDREKIKTIMRRTIITSSFILFPMMIGMAVIAKPMVRIILTDKWLPAVPFLQVFCFTYALWPIHTANLQVLKALGRSDIILKLEILKKVLGIVVLIFCLPMGVFAIALSGAIFGLIELFINSYPNKKLLGYTYFEQFKDVGPSFIVSLITGAVIFFAKYFPLQNWQLLLLQVFFGILIYLSLAKAFNLNGLMYLINISKNIFCKMKR